MKKLFIVQAVLLYSLIGMCQGGLDYNYKSLKEFEGSYFNHEAWSMEYINVYIYDENDPFATGNGIGFIEFFHSYGSYPEYAEIVTLRTDKNTNNVFEIISNKYLTKINKDGKWETYLDRIFKISFPTWTKVKNDHIYVTVEQYCIYYGLSIFCGKEGDLYQTHSNYYTRWGGEVTAEDNWWKKGHQKVDLDELKEILRMKNPPEEAPEKMPFDDIDIH